MSGSHGRARRPCAERVPPRSLLFITSTRLLPSTINAEMLLPVWMRRISGWSSARAVMTRNGMLNETMAKRAATIQALERVIIVGDIDRRTSFDNITPGERGRHDSSVRERVAIEVIQSLTDELTGLRRDVANCQPALLQDSYGVNHVLADNIGYFNIVANAYDHLDLRSCGRAGVGNGANDRARRDR